jgi:hypothetical protein
MLRQHLTAKTIHMIIRHMDFSILLFYRLHLDSLAPRVQLKLDSMALVSSMQEMILRQSSLTVTGDNSAAEGPNASNKPLTLTKTQLKVLLSLRHQSHSKITVRISRITEWLLRQVSLVD